MKTQAETQHVYDPDFMARVTSIADHSAHTVVKILKSYFPIASALDLGCGPGTWLRAWQESGVQDVIGVDGDYVKQDQLLISADNFLPHDLSKPIELKRKFDIAYSLEVAEHIPESCSDVFVDSLTRHSDFIVFSAAVRGQGGEHHVNEQPIDYWREKFEAAGYRSFDAIRPYIEADSQVKPWYRYNTLVYAHQSISDALPDSVLKHALPLGAATPIKGDLTWKIRLQILKLLSQSQREWLARRFAKLWTFFNKRKHPT